MYCVGARKKSRPVIILLSLLMLWTQVCIAASPAFAESAEQTPVAQQVYAYKDMTPVEPNYIFANYLKKAGIMAGFPDGTFRPLDGLTRAEAATVLVKAAGLQAGTAATGFRGVNTRHWAAKNIAAAKSAGLSPVIRTVPSAPMPG